MEKFASYQIIGDATAAEPAAPGGYGAVLVRGADADVALPQALPPSSTQTVRRNLDASSTCCFLPRITEGLQKLDSAEATDNIHIRKHAEHHSHLGCPSHQATSDMLHGSMSSVKANTLDSISLTHTLSPSASSAGRTGGGPSSSGGGPPPYGSPYGSGCGSPYD
ncbi:hypothetical protein KC360_g97 [Hortaea werneckii]|nr:hypothetical protein KC344_g95 [Hortaea werneckii]KAI7180560.1 hypothetical protein KC360_g97 [Hortaea werneckii]